MTADFRSLRVNDLSLGALLAQMVLNLRLPGGQAINDRLLVENTGLSVSSVLTSLLPGGTGPPYSIYWALCGGYNILVFDGAPSAGTARYFFNGYAAPDINGSNTVAASIKDAYYTVLQAAGFNPYRPTILAGWSMGGAVAQAMALQLCQPAVVVGTLCVTFGAPACFREPGLQQMIPVPTCRYMTPGDWIPLVPAVVATIPGYAWTTGLSTIGVYSRYSQTRGGVLLNQDGSTSAAELPPATIPASVNLVSNWFSTLAPPSDHSIQVYLALLQLAVTVRTPSNPVYSPDTPGGEGTGGGYDAPAGPAVPVNPASGPGLSRAARAGGDAIRAQGAAQEAPALVIPPSQLFTASRFGTVWTVYFGGQAVAVAPTKKRARRMARDMNDALRSMQTQAFVDPASLLQGLTEYLAAASAVGGGFAPILMTTLPEV